MADPFDEIHRLSRKAQYDQALGLLLDSAGRKIRAPYDDDLNHAWYVVGDLYYKKQDFQAAAQAFDKSVAARSDDSEALMALADCYSELQMPGMAERYLRIALKYGETIALTYNLGNALFDQERFDEALLEYEKIPRSAGDLYDLAQRNIAAARQRIDADC